ncbi:hypothetical protein BN1221_04999c [Brenneria goodwinii]|uniref:Uncharacterized protein n=1 Tax=Brenneria goodwinii TaxID=1109412 RepID=A0A0G4K3E5_9GAMM|nr:hypothetical protein BN1221_04999c [Brenneria goodwinii]
MLFSYNKMAYGGFIMLEVMGIYIAYPYLFLYSQEDRVMCG